MSYFRVFLVNGEIGLRTTGNLPPLPLLTLEGGIQCALLYNGIHIPEESQTAGIPKFSNLGRVTWPFLCEGTILFNS